MTTLHWVLLIGTVWAIGAGCAVIFMGMPARADHDAPETSRIPEPATPETIAFFEQYDPPDLSLIGYLDEKAN